MSRSNRRSNLEAGGWVVVGALLISLCFNFAHYVVSTDKLAFREFNKEEEDCRRASYRNPPPPDLSTFSNRQQNLKTYREKKAEGEKGARDYCVQRRAAIATERQAVIADIALWLGGFTLAAAVFAAIFARYAAIATDRSAYEAKRSANVAESSLIATLGASVIVRNYRDSPVIDREDKVVAWRFWVEWENIGTTQTKDMESIVVGTTSLKAFPDDHVFSNSDKPGKGVIGPRSTINSGTLTIPAKLVEDMLVGKAFYYFWGWSEYSLTIPDTPRYRVEFHTRIVFNGDPLAKQGGATFEMHGTQQGQREVAPAPSHT